MEVASRGASLMTTAQSGIGKSTLINRAFGIDEAVQCLWFQENDNQRGNAKIEDEIVSPSNNRFVLHDSNGFEAGDINKYQTVTGFITARNNRQDAGDKLHAIW
ncbi:hypothetical protein ID866_8351 [Astraeus odoratus]|nr:hypothetical protein ID866_8351 [Astraeus odoratus]